MFRKEKLDPFHGFPKECFRESLANKDNPEWLARQVRAATQQREAARQAREQRQRAAQQVHIQRQEKAGRREDAQQQKASGPLPKYVEYHQDVQYSQREPMRQQSLGSQAQVSYPGVEQLPQNPIEQQNPQTQASNSPNGDSPNPKKPRIEDLGPEDLASVADFAWELMSRMDSGLIRPTA